MGLLLAFALTAAAHAQMSGLGVSAIMVTSSGSGYTSAPNVTISGGGGSGATATAVVSGGYVTNIVITSPGSGYGSAPDVLFANGGGSGASATAQVSGLVIENAPNLWAVVGGVYRYTPVAESNGAGAMITLTPLQLPPWLNFDGTLLSGTPTSDRLGLKDLVVIQATDTASNMTTYSFRINVGNTVGPVATTPSGGSVQWVTGMPQVARGGDTVLVTGVNGAGTIPTFWGLDPSGFGMEMNFNGPAGFGGDFAVPGNFAFAAGEIGTWLTGAQNLAGGTGVWLGNTHLPSSIGGASISTYLSAQAIGFLSAPVPFQTADTLGLDQTVGVVAQVGFNGGMSIAMQLNVNGVYPGGTPALNFFNGLQFKQPTDRTVTQVESAFYWVNTSPALTSNDGASVLQGGAVVLTASMLSAVDNEQADNEITFTIPNSVDGGPPVYGVLETDDGSNMWATTLAAGSSFTLAQVESGFVRYVNDGEYQPADGFEFGVTDGFGGYARDGDYTTFSFPISITYVEHAPVGSTQDVSAGLGATVTGTLAFTDTDIGNLAETYTVSLTGTPALGVLTITDPSTGAFSFVAGSVAGNESVGWQVTDGTSTATGTVNITVANLPPVLPPLSISGASSGAITGTFTPTDPNLPAEAITISVVTPPTKGNVMINGDQLSYTATAGRFGADTFTVEASDSGGATSAPQTVNVMIRPDSITADSVFIAGWTNSGNSGVIQRFNPANGDLYTLVSGLGQQVRGLAWWPASQRLVALATDPSFNGIVSIDPLTGAFSMSNIVTTNGLLTFPIGISSDGPDNVLIGDGGGGVARVTLATGDQQALALGLPGTAFVTAAVASPDGSNNIFVADNEFMENPDNGNLDVADRVAGTFSAPINFSAGGDPTSLVAYGPNSIAVARGGVPVETITVDTLSYTPWAGSPTAPYTLPSGLAADNTLGAWLIADGGSGTLYSQAMGTSDVEPVTAPGLAQAFGIFVLNPATITLGSLSQTYTGSPLSATAMTTPSGLAVTYTYDGSATAPTNPGSYTVVATINDPSYSGTAMGTLTIAQATPDAPTGVTATYGPGEATVTFSAPANVGGSAITGYTVTSIPGGGVDSDAGSTSLTHVITGLVNGTTYTFTVTATNAEGTGPSSAASNGVVPLPTVTATHNLVFSSGYYFMVADTLAYTGVPTAISWTVQAPPGWTLVSDEGVVGDVQPSLGATGALEWDWTVSISTSPIVFIYVLEAPFGATGSPTVSAQISVTEGSTTQYSAAPDPLVINLDIAHSADETQSGSLNLSDLTRVIELYNTRSGSTRTGCYSTNEISEDGFDPDPSRSTTAPFALPYYHSADENQVGNLDLSELTRVIELYNYHSGNTRTGQYSVAVGTEDGFQPGP